MALIKQLLTVIFLYSSLAIAARLPKDNDIFNTVCKDEVGNPVDWFIAYKFPQVKSNDDHFAQGLGYGFITSESGDGDRFVISNLGIDDPNSMIAQTLQPIYEANDNPIKLHSTPLLYAMWNDQTPPGGPGGSAARAHSKGVLLINQNTRKGAWISHSVPQFPQQRKSNLSFFPISGQRSGQIFMCVSFDANKYADAIAETIDRIKPIIYDSFFSKAFVDDHQLYSQFGIRKAAKTLNKLQGPKKSKQTIKTLGGQEIELFAKTRGYKTDIYSTIVSDIYGPLYVQSWQNGIGGRLNSTCKKVMNIDSMTLLDDNDEEIVKWNSTKDHAKWAITDDKNDQRVVCVGDINRMESQFIRGGGLMCLKDEDAWKRMRSLVSTIEECDTKHQFVNSWVDDDDTVEEYEDDEGYDSASEEENPDDDDDDEKEDDRSKRRRIRENRE